MKFGIPSYHRADAQPTAQLLSSFGIPREDIIISTQCLDDFDDYQMKWSDIATVIFRGGSCVSDNRNTILHFLPAGTELVLLDDDISEFRILNRDCRLRPMDKAGFLLLCQRGFSLCKKYKAGAWGLYPVENAFFMNAKAVPDQLLIGTTMGVVVQDGFRFDNTIRVKEDYEYCCHLMSCGQHTIRFNFAVAHAKHRTNKGGCHDDWCGNDDATKKLLLMYPDIVKENPRRPGELLKI